MVRLDSPACDRARAPIRLLAAHYTGRLDDGTVFDSSVEKGRTFKFQLGRGNVIRGWDRGFATMKKGEKAFLTCRADYAYGDRSMGEIPPGATLTFEVSSLV